MLPTMKTNADGSLMLYIQKDSPGSDKEANWLPAPDGPIDQVMRLHWRKTDAPPLSCRVEGQLTAARIRSVIGTDTARLLCSV